MTDPESFAAMAERVTKHYASLSGKKRRAYRRELNVELLCALYRVTGREVSRAVVGEWLDANAGRGPW